MRLSSLKRVSHETESGNRVENAEDRLSEFSGWCPKASLLAERDSDLYRVLARSKLKRSVSAIALVLIASVLAVVVVSMPSTPAVARALKAGDWAEYTATEYSDGWGNMMDTYRVDVINVQTPNVTYKVTLKWFNVAYHNTWDDSKTLAVNLDAGGRDALFIVPAGLNPGDAFSDPILNRVTVSSAPKIGDRTVVHALLSARGFYKVEALIDYRWDVATGMLMEADSPYFSLKLSKTSLWQPSPIGYYIAASVALVATSIVLYKRDRVKALLNRLNKKAEASIRNSEA